MTVLAIVGIVFLTLFGLWMMTAGAVALRLVIGFSDKLGTEGFLAIFVFFGGIFLEYYVWFHLVNISISIST